MVPDFDPCDGGINARMLFLFEKPGPMTDSANGKRGGSGFISRDNDDRSAEATGRFMAEAGIPRSATILWNTIPWWDGAIKFTSAQTQTGLAELPTLLKLLPLVRTVVLVGRTAQRASNSLRDVGLAVFLSAHPSPVVRATSRETWDAIPSQWRQAFEQSVRA
jgi:G:T/U-mismatch repair DNA glycosylase